MMPEGKILIVFLPNFYIIFKHKKHNHNSGLFSFKLLVGKLYIRSIIQQKVLKFLKEMLHLIYKLDLKTVFLCAKYMDAFGFAPKK